MTKEEIFNYFYTNTANLGVKAILMALLGGLAISLIIYITYYICYRGVAYNSKFNNSLVIVNLVAIVIMLMISSNIVISLGMVGALSIIRFRTAIKDSRDTVFIFWSIAEGLAVGSQNFELALITTLFIALVMIITGLIPFSRQKYLIVVTGDRHINHRELNFQLKQYVKSVKVRTASTTDEKTEMIFEVKAKKALDHELLDTLLTVEGVRTVNWIIESGDNIG